MENSPEAVKVIDEGHCLFGTVDTWLIWVSMSLFPHLSLTHLTNSFQNLTGGIDGGVHVTDVTNASRTMLMNIHTLQWDPELCK